LLHLDGSLALVEQDLEHADQALSAALELRRALDVPQQLGMTLSNLGSVANGRGDYRRAEQMFREAIEVFEESAFERGRASTHLNLGLALLNLDRTGEAIETIERAVDGFRMIGDRSEEAHALSRLGYAHADFGDHARAEACRVAAHHITETLGRAPDIAWSHMNLAAHHLETGDVDRARFHAGESARIVRVEALERWWVPGLLELAAHISAATGDAELGARLYGSAVSYRKRRDLAPPEASQAFVTSTQERLEKALGARAWPVAFEVGRAVGLDEALEMIEAWG
jgi:tetratricopeptide (TPR) repeat protein